MTIAAPRNMLDKASCASGRKRRSPHASGFTAHKFGFPHTKLESDHGRDPSNRVLSTKELINIRQGYENCRDAIGWDHDIMVHNHWEYDLRTSIQMAQAVESIKPLWLEDPLQVEYSESWKRLVASSNVPICNRRESGAEAGLQRLHHQPGFAISCTGSAPTRAGFSRPGASPTWRNTYGLPIGDAQHGQQISQPWLMMKSLKPCLRARFSPVQIGTLELATSRFQDSEYSTCSGSSSQSGLIDSTACAI